MRDHVSWRVVATLALTVAACGPPALVYLWPERQPDVGYPYYPYYDPSFGPHIGIGIGGYWGP